MIALDTTALSALFVPGTPLNKAGTTTPIKYGKERLAFLVETIAKARDIILIPTPALSELLVCISPERTPDLLAQLNGSVWFRVEAFDSTAAVELGLRTARAIAGGDKREGLTDAPWTKVKFDRQIVAIAIVNGASEIISDDPDVKAIGARWGMKVTSVEDLPRPGDLIPPPLLAGLEDEDENREKKDSVLGATNVRSGGNGDIEDKAGTETAEEKAGASTGKEETPVTVTTTVAGAIDTPPTAKAASESTSDTLVDNQSYKK